MKKFDPPMNADELRCREKMLRVHLHISAALILLCVCGASAQGCPLCRDSVTPTQAAAFNGSIEWMLGGLIGVMGMLGFRVWRSVIEHHREEASLQASR